MDPDEKKKRPTTHKVVGRFLVNIDFGGRGDMTLVLVYDRRAFFSQTPESDKLRCRERSGKYTTLRRVTFDERGVTRKILRINLTAFSRISHGVVRDQANSRPR